MRGLKGKTAIVTGGAAGIGAAVVERFEAEGTRTIVFDLNSSSPVDITDYAAVKKAVDSPTLSPVADAIGRTSSSAPAAMRLPIPSASIRGGERGAFMQGAIPVRLHSTAP